MNSLVSIIIASFNSSSFIVETLESISKQTWKELELIITDDNSRDDTVEICRKWVFENKQRFFNTEILTSVFNTGISANANRGLNAAKGEWVKFLGADDALKPGCIEDNMVWISFHPEVNVLFSRIEIYNDNFEPRNLINITPGVPYDPKGVLAWERSADSQYKMLLISDRIHFSPSVFLHRKTLLSVGGFDERFRLLEDYPLWLNLTRNGHKLHYVDKVTVNYRQHSKAINNTGIDYLINPNYFNSEDFRKIYTYPFLPADVRLCQRFRWYGSQIFRIAWVNKNKKPNRFLLTLLTISLNPFKHFIYLKKRFRMDLKFNVFYE